MNTLWFKYKHWYNSLINFVNILIPFLLIIPVLEKIGVDKITSVQEVVFKVKLHEFVPQTIIFSCIFAIFTYIYKSLFENRALADSFKKPVENFKYFCIGSGIMFLSWNIAAFSSAANWILSQNNSAQSIMPIVFGVSSGLTFLLGIISNIFINYYEFMVSFEIYYKRNKEEVIEKFLVVSDNRKLMKSRSR